MLTVREALVAATARLTAAGVDTPGLDAQVLLAHVLGVDRAWLIVYSDAPLIGVNRARFARLVALRETHTPVAYLVGHREFFGLDFSVDERVLIPRPETELLVERAIELARDWQARTVEWPTIVDVGTGSGAIVISLAVRLPAIPRLYAVDLSHKALTVAQANAKRHHVEDRVRFLQGDLLEGSPEPVALIVANLPYIPTGDLGALQPEVQKEPRSALDGGPGGLDFFQRLFDQLPAFVLPGAVVLLEIGFDQAEAVVRLAESLRPASIRVKKDLAGLDRLVEVQLGDTPYPSHRH